MSAAESKEGFLTLRLEVEVVKALELKAKRNDRSRSAEIRVALRKHASKEIAEVLEDAA